MSRKTNKNKIKVRKGKMPNPTIVFTDKKKDLNKNICRSKNQNKHD